MYKNSEFVTIPEWMSNYSDASRCKKIAKNIKNNIAPPVRIPSYCNKLWLLPLCLVSTTERSFHSFLFVYLFFFQVF